MEGYIKVDILEYVKEGLEKGTLIPFYAIKYGSIHVRQGVPSEEIITWSVDDFGNPIEEKVSVVKIDSETNKPQYVVTKLDDTGKPLIDQNGHKNEWIVNPKTLSSKYEVDKDNSSIYHPKVSPQIFVQIDEDIILEQWGSEMKIAKGGFINITNPNDMYGISSRDFYDTYRRVNELDNNNQMKL